MSDVFAIMCDQWFNKHTVDESSWLIGKDMLVEGQALRFLLINKLAICRIIILECVYTIAQEYLIEHFTLRVEKLEVIVILGKRLERWYIALKDRLTEYSKFQDVADHLFEIAGSVFGKESKEQNAVHKGWEAVGILPRIEGPDIAKVISEKTRMQE